MREKRGAGAFPCWGPRPLGPPPLGFDAACKPSITCLNAPPTREASRRNTAASTKVPDSVRSSFRRRVAYGVAHRRRAATRGGGGTASRAATAAPGGEHRG